VEEPRPLRRFGGAPGQELRQAGLGGATVDRVGWCARGFRSQPAAFVMASVIFFSIIGFIMLAGGLRLATPISWPFW